MLKLSILHLSFVLAFASINGLIIPDNFNKTYQSSRAAVIEAENLLSTGGQMQLNSQELKVNEIFQKYKSHELEIAFNDSDQDPTGMHFFKGKPFIDRSKVFNFLQQMPKGALLHIHTSSSVSSKWIVENIFNMPGLMKCINDEGVAVLTFRQTPEKHNCTTPYVLISDERNRSGSVEDYDLEMEKIINLYTNEPELDYPSINVVWSKFQNIFVTMSDVLLYLPVFRLYHWQMLEEMYNDNVMYAEVRANFYKLYDKDGKNLSPDHSITELYNLSEKFKKLHPDFLGIKLIYSTKRSADFKQLHERIEIYKKYQKLYPNFIIGFDLVGQEDKGKPLKSFVNVITELPPGTKFFFHAGETNWYGSTTDYNLLDAILLNTTRIGHGYALMKHPILWNAVISGDIAIEVNPISNQVLKLVADLRNHPASLFVSQNIPMVICNDDPGFWNAKGLSYDFYYAIMSFAPNNAGLRTLKQLVWNSIKYSALQSEERQKAYKVLQLKWDKFLEKILI